MVLKRRAVRIILWCSVIGMMVLIFSMSAQPGDDSLSMSDLFVRPLMALVSRVMPDLPQETMDSLYWTLQTIVRKGAHMAEYALLALLIRLLLTSYDWRRTGLWSWCFAVAYAATDEFHQSLVSARTAQMMDVGVDGAGAFIGVVLAGLVIRAILRKSK